MKRGDLVIVRGAFEDVPLYPGGDFEMRPFLAQSGDLVILLDNIHRINHGYVNVLHPVGGICSVFEERLDPFEASVNRQPVIGITGS